MTTDIKIVTDPDDVTDSNNSLLLVNLSGEQKNLVFTADSLRSSQIKTIYVWESSDSMVWLNDKMQKSSLIICNADSPNRLITGFVLNSAKSHYFGLLPELNIINPRTINSSHYLNEIMEKI